MDQLKELLALQYPNSGIKEKFIQEVDDKLENPYKEREEDKDSS